MTTLIPTDNSGLNFTVKYISKTVKLKDLELEKIIYKINTGKDLVQYLNLTI